MDDFFDSNSSSLTKKIAIVIVILLITVLVICFLTHRFKHTLHLKEKVVYEIGDKISYDISQYVTNEVVDSSDYSLSFNEVPISDGRVIKVGKYSYKVKYKNISKKGTIVIEDTVKPSVETRDLIIGLNEEYDLDDFLTSCNDYSKPCEVTYKNEKDDSLSSQVGKHTFSILISDQYGNKTEEKVNLEVRKNYSSEQVKKDDLTIHHTDPVYDDFNNILIIKYDEAISEEKLELDEKYLELQEIIGYDLTSYLPSNYIDETIKDAQIITVYNKYNYIVGFALRVELNNGINLYLSK